MRARSIYLSIMFAGLIAIHGCGTIAKNEAEPTVDFTEFQNLLREVLYQATLLNYSKPKPPSSLEEILDNIREAYKSTLGDDAQMDIFDDAVRQVVEQSIFSLDAIPRDSEYEIITTIIQESTEPREAIIALDELIASGELQEEHTMMAIILREQIVYLANNSMIFEYIRLLQLKEQNTSASSEDDVE